MKIKLLFVLLLSPFCFVFSANDLERPEFIILRNSIECLGINSVRGVCDKNIILSHSEKEELIKIINKTYKDIDNYSEFLVIKLTLFGSSAGFFGKLFEKIHDRWCFENKSAYCDEIFLAMLITTFASFNYLAHLGFNKIDEKYFKSKKFKTLKEIENLILKANCSII